MDARSHKWMGSGLELHVREWGAGDATALVVHGFQDSSATWDEVAVGLAAGGLRVVAPDMRGFGDSDRVPRGGYYHFADYVADVAAIARAHVRGPLFLVGHSMGATVVSYFAGALPERVTKLALVDGVGPPDSSFDVGPLRMRRWIEQTIDEPRVAPKAMTRDDAAARLARFNPDVDPAILARKASQLVREVEGGVAWKHDPLHATTSPTAFFAETYEAFARRVACPVLYVSGGARGFHVPDEEERLACFARLTRVTIEGGHALHWSKATELAEALVEFWKA